MTRINNIIKELDANETILDQFDLDLLQDELTEETLSVCESSLEDEEDLVSWIKDLNRF